MEINKNISINRAVPLPSLMFLSKRSLQAGTFLLCTSSLHTNAAVLRKRARTTSSLTLKRDYGQESDSARGTDTLSSP